MSCFCVQVSPRTSPRSQRKAPAVDCNQGTQVSARTHAHTHADPHSRTDTHTDMHARTHADTPARTHTHTDTHTHMHAHKHAVTHTRTDTHTDTHTHTPVRTHRDTHTHAHIHADMHAHTHTHKDTHASMHTDTQTRTHPHTDTHTHTPAHTDTHTRTHTRRDETVAVQWVRATICQGDIKDDENDPRDNARRSNSQCTCMALTFLADQKEGLRFNTSSLDSVLRRGDALYKGIIHQLYFDSNSTAPLIHRHLAREEFPKQVFTERNVYGVHHPILRAGWLKPSDDLRRIKPDERLPFLEEDLQCLSQDVTHALLIVAPECFAVFHDTTTGRYGVFDSHSRSAKGLPTPGGRAILLTFRDLGGLVVHFERLFKERSPSATYELMPISFEIGGYDETPVQPANISITTARAAIDQGYSETAGPSTSTATTAAINCGPSDTPVQSRDETPIAAKSAIDCGSSETPGPSTNRATTAAINSGPSDTAVQSTEETPIAATSAIVLDSNQAPRPSTDVTITPVAAPLPKPSVFELSLKRGRRQGKQQFQAVRATICQGDIVGQHPNKQCTCMALTFLAHHKDRVDFNTASLDKVLYQGDGLYKDIIEQLQLDGDHLLQEQSYLLTMEQLRCAEKVSTNDNVYRVELNMSNLKTGPLHKTVRKNLSLAEQLQKSFLQDGVTHALLMVTPECFAVFRDRSGHYGLFDSHSRSADGLPVPDLGGKAIMLTFDDPSGLAGHLHQILKGRRRGVSYELMPVAFELDYATSMTPAVPTPTPAVPTYKLSKVSKARRRKIKQKVMQSECIDQSAPLANKGLRTSDRAQYEKLRYRIPKIRLKKLKAEKHRWATDAALRQRRSNIQKHRWATDAAYRQKCSNIQKHRRATDAAFRDRWSNVQKHRRANDAAFREKWSNVQKHRWATDAAFRSRQNAYHRERLNNDPEYRQQRIQRCTKNKKQRLEADAVLRIRHKLQCAMRLKRKSVHIINRSLQIAMEEAILAFRESIQHGPTYVCTVCHRLMFSNQVRWCNRDKYTKNPDIVTACLTGKYVHICDCECSDPCVVAQERRSEYICSCCHFNLKQGRMPSIAAANKLELAPVPPGLQLLNMLESQVIAKFLPFAKVVSLPKGRQRAVHGPVVCVPSEVEAIVNALPRSSNEDQLLQVKLKRHIKYKGYQFFYTVNMTNVLAALRILKEMHPEYRDIVINENATFDRFQDEQSDDEEDAQEQTTAATSDKQQQQQEQLTPGPTTAATKNEQQQEEPTPGPSTAVTTDEQKEELRPGLTFDTCMQPPDIAQEILSFGEGIFSIAPAQGNRPVGVFKVPKLESMAFPKHFPDGRNTLDEVRAVKLFPSRYFNVRLFSVDTRFATDQTYLFYGQYLTESHIATNSMSIQVRKGKKFTRDGRVLSNKMLQDKEEVERLVRNKDATRFMQPLRGCPTFWERALRDLLAMSRQIGRPNWFVTLSAAEMRWPEFIKVIKAQQGEQGDYSQLDWVAKCEIVRSNPVTLMRMFLKRFERAIAFMESAAMPIGEVTDYFYRIEFQARGSPHVHMMVWVKDAPALEDPRVIRFINKYVTCKMPDQYADPELHKIVSEVQVHSRSHSRSCKKGNVTCRFGFPKLPMDETIITVPPIPQHLKDLAEALDGGQAAPQPPPMDEDKGDEEAKKDENAAGQKGEGRRRKGRRKETEEQKEAKEKLAPLRDLLNNPKASFKDLPDVLEKCNLTAEQYREYVDNLSTAPTIHLRRRPDECWINQYNPHLLRVWDANMDIQYILDDYSCAQYMLGYVAKPEHEMSELLTEVVKEVRKSKPNTKEMDEMKHIMHAYVQHREVSAQEAVARVCSLPLKGCTRTVVFLQTDEDGLRMSKPMSKLKEMDPDTDEVWMSGIPEKYLNRPRGREFEYLCMAEFASEYRVVPRKDKDKANVSALLNDMGFIVKRAHLEKAAIIRFHRFSEKKSPEKFYRGLLKLYLPHRNDSQLKNKEYPTYEQFYKNGSARFACADWSVKMLVDRNKDKYEGRGKHIEKAVEVVQVGEMPILDAWKDFDPEVEADGPRLRKAGDPEEQDEVPEYQVHPSSSKAIPRIDAPELSPDYVRSMYRSLNETQASIFYTVRQWCWRRVWRQDPDPFYYFISGGAGCGKSHVIKCIYHEATKILRQLPSFLAEADMTQPAVLLAAFTGTAAFNISGKTLHSLLKLPRSLKGPYKSLGNALDDMRGALWTAEILVIDEISMVSKDVFDYVNLRLQQIKGNRKPFGGMSVLAVGDFYQLPPINGKPLCNADCGIWADFQLVELTEIMRQRDDRIYAELLNRLRVKGKRDRLSTEDRALLTQACTEGQDGPHDVLHIFARNQAVDDHNEKAIEQLGTEIFTILAEDYTKDSCTGEMRPLLSPREHTTRRDLEGSISVAQGARVMVTRNLDVEDGIVNGTFGTIANIVSSTSDRRMVNLLGLTLDSPTAGQNFRKKIQGPTDELVYIERFEEGLANTKSTVRRQFPVKLAFGCTIHKVQGMTVSSAVVSLKDVDKAGMAYVALSRTTSLQGLRIRDFNERTIFADPDIKMAMQSLNRASFQLTRPLMNFAQQWSGGPTLTIVHHNTQGLMAHIQDVKAHHEFRHADVLLMTETNLSGASVPPEVDLEGYHLVTRNRHVSYTSANTAHFATKKGGGVAAYYRSSLQADPLRLANVSDLEFAVIRVEAPVKALIATVYRPPKYKDSDFCLNLGRLLDTLASLDCQPVVVCGDFNEDLLKTGRKNVKEQFEAKGYSQLISTATTQEQTLIDHIYISQPGYCLQSGVLHTYYSYHDAIYCVLTSAALSSE